MRMQKVSLSEKVLWMFPVRHPLLKQLQVQQLQELRELYWTESHCREFFCVFTKYCLDQHQIDADDWKHESKYLWQWSPTERKWIKLLSTRKSCRSPPIYARPNTTADGTQLRRHCRHPWRWNIKLLTCSQHGCPAAKSSSAWCDEATVLKWSSVV